MHLLLTDLLSCPRCGPEFGLILLADRIEERRVAEGRLGCANCRETYPVRGGVADLRAGGGPSAGEAEEPPADAEEAAVRLAALLGLTEGGGAAVIVGPGANLAPGVASLTPEVEVVALLASPPEEAAAAPGVSRVAAGARLPFRDRTVRGVALTGGADGERLREALRVVLPGGRIVVDEAGPETAERLRAAGAELLLEQEGSVVARVPGPAAAAPGRRPG